jgi:hypothetical protein
VGRGLLIAFFLGISYGIAVAGSGALITFLLSRTTIISTVNGIMGSAMQITPGLLYETSILFGIVVTVFSAIIIWFKIILYNIGSKIIGAPVVTIGGDHE